MAKFVTVFGVMVLTIFVGFKFIYASDEADLFQKFVLIIKNDGSTEHTEAKSFISAYISNKSTALDTFNKFENYFKDRDYYKNDQVKKTQLLNALNAYQRAFSRIENNPISGEVITLINKLQPLNESSATPSKGYMDVDTSDKPKDASSSYGRKRQNPHLESKKSIKSFDRKNQASPYYKHPDVN